MISECFSVFDQAAKRFLDPFFAPTTEFAIRSFKEACQREGHQFGKFPEDYVLFQIGCFDAENGQFSAWEPRKVSMALDHVSAPSLTLDQAVNDG